MAKSALPLLLLGGVAVVLGSKKKKKKKTTSTEGALADADTTDTTDTGKKDDPYAGLPKKPPYGGESTGKPKPKPSTGGGSKIPGGNPPNDAGPGEYNHAYWDSQAKIFEIFVKLGYNTPEGRTTMNDPGPDGKLGGDDDVKNPQVGAFQKDYNAVSKSKTFGSNMGGLNPDQYVGPKVLNGLKYVVDHLGGKNWKADVVKGAADKGYKA